MNSDEDCPVTPPKKYKRGSKLFVDDWLTSAEFNGWLEKVPDDVTKAKCKACKTFLNCGKSDLQKHAAGKKHNDKIKLIKTSVNIRDALQRPTSDSEKKQSVKETEIRLAAFFAEHNLAFHLSDHLTDVIGKCFTDSAIAKDLTLNRTKCTSIVKNIIANVESTETINNLRHLPFSILVDESTDITDHKFMCDLVRYMSPTTGRVRTELLELILSDATDCSQKKFMTHLKIV